jgi:hypothetical protein
MLAGCRDELPIDSGSPSVVGYRIEGSVVDSLERGVSGVAVRLAYTYLFVDSEPPQSRRLIVPHTGSVVIDIYDLYDNIVRQVFSGNVGPGEISYSWDHRDGFGRLVGSGLYFYSFSLDGQELVGYPILVDSAVTASTDSSGNFVVEDIHFPIGATIPRFSNSGTFLGNFLIYGTVNLIFGIDDRSAVREVTLSEGRLITLKQSF